MFWPWTRAREYYRRMRRFCGRWQSFKKAWWLFWFYIQVKIKAR